jgi:hypothetical protein
MNDHEDPDWEALAAEAEWAEKMGEINAIATRILNSPALDVTKQPPGTRLVVCPVGYEEEENPGRDTPVEFNILDPASLKVLVTDPKNFPEPTEGTLLGSGQMNGNLTAPGQLKRLDWLIYQVGGKKYQPHNNTISRVEIYRPGRAEPLFVLWQE